MPINCPVFLVESDDRRGGYGGVRLGNDGDCDGVAAHGEVGGGGVKARGTADGSGGNGTSGDAVDLPDERVVDAADCISEELLGGAEGDTGSCG